MELKLAPFYSSEVPCPMVPLFAGISFWVSAENHGHCFNEISLTPHNSPLEGGKVL